MIFGEITLGHYLALSSLLFLIGLAGVILRRSLLIIMMSLELLLNAANLALVAVGRFQGLPDPQVAVFFVIMLLDVKEEARRTPPWVKIVGVLSVGGVAILGLTKIVPLFPFTQKTLHWGLGKGGGSASELGKLLFTSYSPLFLATGVLLLVTTVGVVVLCRKDPES